MTRAVVIRAIVLSLALLALSAFAVDWNELLFPGRVRRTDDAMVQGDPTILRARIAGYVAAVPIADDQAVHRGDLLYGIDESDYAARVRRAEADVAGAQADVAQAEAQIRLQTAQLGISVAAIHASDAQAELAGQELHRQQALAHTESFLRRDYENAQSAMRRQAAVQAGDRKGLAAEQAQIIVLRAQLDAQKANLAGKRADLELARVNLGYTRVTAPFDGFLAARLVRAGAYVAPGTALITEVDPSQSWVVANYREVQLRHIAAGQHAVVRIDALPGARLQGRVASFQPTSEAFGSAMPPDRAAGNFTKIVQRVPVRVLLDHRADLAGRLQPGLSAEVSIDTDREGP